MCNKEGKRHIVTDIQDHILHIEIHNVNIHDIKSEYKVIEETLMT